jgi:hypothetical protein
MPLRRRGRQAQTASFVAVPTSRFAGCVGGRAVPGRPGSMRMAGGDLLVVGAGTLGMRLIKQYKEEYPSAQIVACTNTTKRHADLKTLGAEPILGLPDRQFPNVAFLATPDAKDYIGLCNRALDVWSAPSQVFSSARPPANRHLVLVYKAAVVMRRVVKMPVVLQGGSYILASSIGVFAKGVPEGTRLTEADATNASSSNFSRTLVAAEDLTLSKGGTVMRIAGMYNLRPGRNSFFLKGGEVKRRGDAYISLVGYDDVVSAALKILAAPPPMVAANVFIVSDGHAQVAPGGRGLSAVVLLVRCPRAGPRCPLHLRHAISQVVNLLTWSTTGAVLTLVCRRSSRSTNTATPASGTSARIRHRFMPPSAPPLFLGASGSWDARAPPQTCKHSVNAWQARRHDAGKQVGWQDGGGGRLGPGCLVMQPGGCQCRDQHILIGTSLSRLVRRVNRRAAQ